MRLSAPIQAVACVLAALVFTALPGCADAPPARYAALHGSSEGFAFSGDTASEPRRAAPPLRLTASDGTGLRLAAIEARAIVEEPLAFTELRLTFDNPEDRVLEGTFQITLPEGAAISRFAMRMGDDAWQEGEVVEKKQARRAYEDFLHHKQDPALLEQAAGNEFSARVFPIAPRARKEIIVSYSQELGEGRPYALPLRGLPELGKLDVTVTGAGDDKPLASMHERAFTPAEDLRLDERSVAGGQGLRAGNLVLARVRPIPAAPPDPLGPTLILVDTSASRALGYEDEIRLVARLAKRLAETGGAGTPLVVGCYDQTTELLFDGAAGVFGEGEVRRMRARQAFGASDLGRALGWAEETARARGLTRVLIVGDGVATAGDVEAGALAMRAAKLAGAGVQRLDAIAVGGIRDDAVLRKLATAGLPRDGVVADASADPAGVDRRIERSTRSGLAVTVEGARWWWPQRLDGVQPGDEVRIYADVPEGQPVRVRVGGSKTQEMELSRVERPLIERAWVKARIDSLLEQQEGEVPKEAVVREVIALSTAHRVLSPYTSLLVLETERDFMRFGLDRKALADILTVEGGRLAVARRSVPEPAADEGGTRSRDVAPEPERTVALHAPSAPVAPWGAPEPGAAPSARGNMWGQDVGDSFGAGGLGLSGAGEGGGGHAEGIGIGGLSTVGHGAGTGTGQGFGSGHGRLGGAHAAATPSVRAGAMEIRQSHGRIVEAHVLRPPQVRESASRTVAVPPDEVQAQPREARTAAPPPPLEIPPEPREKPSHAEPYTGRFRTVMDQIGAGGAKAAIETAFAWHSEAPGDVMALVALGEALEASGEIATAARAYGSILDLFPARADLRRFAGERLERLQGNAGLDLALDTFAKAEDERPDHPASHRLLAYARLKSGDHAGAFAAALRGVKQPYPEGRFPGVIQILREDLGLIGAAWIKAEPARRDEILDKVREAGGIVEDAPSIRFVLNWETDANDVDFHIFDAEGGHAYYRQKELPSGGNLYADVTTGYGPECFTIRAPRAKRSERYELQAHYYARGPMGYGMGKLEVIDHDGKGGISFDERPFVVMADKAFVDLGAVVR
jgi:tetratricopeptide (TPR) repeat protein